MFCIFFKKFLFLKILNHNNTIHGHTFSRLSLVYVNIMNVFSFPPFCQFTNYLRDPLNHPLTHAGGLEENYEDLPRILPRFFFHFLRFLPHKQTCPSELWKSRFDSLMKGKNRKLIEKEKRKRIRNIFFLFIYIFSIRQSEFELRTTTKNPIIFCFNYFCIKQFVWNFVRWRKTILKR